MSLYGEGQIDVILAKMRKLMVREPNISGRGMATTLGYNKDFIAKLKRKLERQIKENVDRSIISEDIGKLQNIYTAMSSDMWDIINDPLGNKKDKIAAFAVMFDKYNALIDRKMDAGIFERKLGSLEINEWSSAVYSLILENRKQNEKRWL